MSEEQRKARRAETFRRWKEKNPERYRELQQRYRVKRGTVPRTQRPGQNTIADMVASLKAGTPYRTVAAQHGCSPSAVEAWTSPWRAAINQARGPSARQTAVAFGETRYVGAVCRRHPELGGERYTVNRKCPGCYNDYRRRSQYRAKERDRRRAAYAPIKAANAAARAERKAKEQAEKRKLREEKRTAAAARKRERKRAARRDYYRRKPEKRKVLRARRRAAQRAAIVPLTAAEGQRIEALYADARRRTVETGEQWDVHHKIPLARGGKHHPDNLEVVPAAINNAIGDREMSGLDYLLS